jgi:hypothetical protein
MTAYNGTIDLCSSNHPSKTNILVKTLIEKVLKNVEPPLKCPIKPGTYNHSAFLQHNSQVKKLKYQPTFLKTIGSSYMNISFDVYTIINKERIRVISNSDLLLLNVKN